MKPSTDPGLLSGLFHSIPNPIFLVDRQGRLVVGNQAFLQLFAIGSRDMEGLHLDKLLPPDVAGLFGTMPGRAHNREIAITGADGTTRHWAVSVLSSRFVNKPVEVITLRDITGQKQTEESLRESEELYRTLVNQLPHPILIHVNRQVVFANEMILAVTGMDQREVIGKDVAEILSDPTDTSNRSVYRNLTGSAFTAEEEFEVRTPGRGVVIRNFIIRNTRIKYLGSDAVLTILTDITERKHLERYVLGKMMETEEKNRRQMAADLHDDLGPILSSIKLHLGLLEQPRSPEKNTETLAIINTQLAETIAKMRIISNNLMPRLIDQFGLEAAVNAFLATMQQKGTFTVRFTCNLAGRRFPKQTELHLYRIVCELVNNTVKHAGASRAGIRLSYEKGILTLVYSDNGKGYNVEEIGKRAGGMGLGNIIQRANLIDAEIRFIQRKDRTEVRIRLTCP